jgi:hypothetical protein
MGAAAARGEREAVADVEGRVRAYACVLSACVRLFSLPDRWRRAARLKQRIVI